MNEQTGIGHESYFSETEAIIEQLTDDPTIAFECLHGDGPAVGIYDVPGGCVAWPDTETQALCPQHVLTDGSFEGMFLVIDLSLNAAWSKYLISRGGCVADYVIMRDTIKDKLSLISSATVDLNS